MIELRMRVRLIIALTLLSAVLLGRGSARADLVFPDGSIQTTAAPHRANFVHVPASGTGADNGIRLRNAIADISDASANKPYLVQLDPGRYNVGAVTLTMKPYVSLRGALAEESEIAGSAAVVVGGANAATLCDLAIESASPGTTLYKLSGDDGATQIATALWNVEFDLNMESGTGVAVAIDNDADAVFKGSTIRNKATGANVGRTGISVAGGDTLSTRVEFWKGSIQLESSNSLAFANAANVAFGAALELRGTEIRCQNISGDATRTGVIVASGAAAFASHCVIDAADFTVSNSGIYEGFAVDHTGMLPAEDPPSSGADTTYTLYLQCTLNDAEI